MIIARNYNHIINEIKEKNQIIYEYDLHQDIDTTLSDRCQNTEQGLQFLMKERCDAFSLKWMNCLDKEIYTGIKHLICKSYGYNNHVKPEVLPTIAGMNFLALLQLEDTIQSDDVVYFHMENKHMLQTDKKFLIAFLNQEQLRNRLDRFKDSHCGNWKADLGADIGVNISAQDCILSGNVSGQYKEVYLSFSDYRVITDKNTFFLTNKKDRDFWLMITVMQCVDDKKETYSCDFPENFIVLGKDAGVVEFHEIEIPNPANSSKLITVTQGAVKFERYDSKNASWEEIDGNVLKDGNRIKLRAHMQTGSMIHSIMISA